MYTKILLPALNPLTAVTDADPYSYYADLVTRQPFYHDTMLGLWVASSAEAVESVLTSNLCSVRPPGEPVPKALLGSPAADIFRQLVRMNDGPSHRPSKRAIAATLGEILPARLIEQSNKWACYLSAELEPQGNPRRLSDFIFRLPVYVIASLLGVPPDQLPKMALWVSAFVRCLSPTSYPEQLEQGKAAAGQLLDMFRSLLATRQAGSEEGLLVSLKREARIAGCQDTDTIVANSIGLLSQAYEATAGLLGNTLLAWASQPQVRAQVTADLGLLPQLLQEVLLYDPPIQNTRRFVAAHGIVAGREVNEGDGILVVLAAANRDPLANPQPERFDLFRQNRQIFTFGVGAHACAGEVLATTIAQAGVEQLIKSGIEPESLAEPIAYRASVNVRIPLWGRKKAHNNHTCRNC